MTTRGAAHHKVLIVDDEPVARSIEALALEGTGRYFAVEAANASDALGALSHGGYDCAVIDLDMPDMSGLELISRIRSSKGGSRLPIVLVLPEHANGMEREPDPLGFTRTVTKPFDPWDLARLLDQLAGPLDGQESVLSVEAVLKGFPYPTMILDADHHVLLANSGFYEVTRTGIGECYLDCVQEMHEGVMPSNCPLEVCAESGTTCERTVDTVFGSLRVSVYPLATRMSDGRRLYLHVTQPT